MTFLIVVLIIVFILALFSTRSQYEPYVAFTHPGQYLMFTEPNIIAEKKYQKCVDNNCKSDTDYPCMQYCYYNVMRNDLAKDVCQQVCDSVTQEGEDTYNDCLDKCYGHSGKNLLKYP